MTDHISIDKIAKIQELASDVERGEQEKLTPIEPNREQFERLMAENSGQNQPKQQVAIAEEAKKISPMELSTPTHHPSSRQIATTQELLSQTNEAVQRMESIKRKLSTPALELPNHEVHALKNKLSHIQDSIQVALAKVGIDYVPPEAPKGLLSPLQKFLGYMTHGQSQLEKLNIEIEALQEHNDHLNPAKMLALQQKIGFINGELEFFASALNKSLESFKTILNVQV